MSWSDVINNNNVTLNNASLLEKTTFNCKSGTISSTNFVLGFV